MPHLHTAEDFTAPFAALVRRLAPHASLRIGETAAVDLSGVAGVTDSFVHGFWATQQYGWLARSGSNNSATWGTALRSGSCC